MGCHSVRGGKGYKVGILTFKPVTPTMTLSTQAVAKPTPGSFLSLALLPTVPGKAF